MVEGSAAFEVFTHLGYAVRHWPTEQAGPLTRDGSKKGSDPPCGRWQAADEHWR